ncbi:MAG: glucose-6-phosphate dehydrogenase assembly protein OpcA [Candidatus Melainabacteria bacterium]|nr:glucose-6-phosphate dehydrogenase assembly protein OpcA [Candidatus Melainabacteria bacterium]
MNLILYSEDADAEIVAGDVLDDITTRHPCRAILAISRQSSTPSLEAWVSARCHITDSKSGKQICCEQITVRSEGNGPQELTSVVLPLVISDLPVFLWWRAKKVDFASVRPFLTSVDELIVDSAKDEGSCNFFSDVIHIIGAYLEEKHGAQIVVSDLNWRRSLLWREALALSFDEQHGHLSLDALKEVKSVEINYVAGKSECNGNLNQTLLFIGWLANKLGWQFKSASKSVVHFTAGKNNIDVNIISNIDGDASHIGNICSLEVSFNDASLPSVVLKQTSGAPGVQMFATKPAQATAAQAPQHDFRFKVNQATEARLIDLELETIDRDPTLEGAFRMAAVIADQISAKAK